MSLGIGVMLNNLGGNEETVSSIALAKGKEIEKINIDNDCLVISFIDGSQIKLYDDGQSCCEHRYMNCDDDMSKLIGGKLVSFEILSADNNDAEDWCHEIQFLRVITDRGDMRVSNHNEHNGYYGGFAIVARYSPSPESNK